MKEKNDVVIHAFTDGRDTDPKSGLHFITELQQHIQHTVGKIGTVSGRYFAMDRDKRWERVKLAYDAMVLGIGEHANDAVKAVADAYQHNITDEFIKPTVIGESSTIKDGDTVICFNFRTDRCRGNYTGAHADRYAGIRYEKAGYSLYHHDRIR